MENGWIQEMSAPENYQPDFEREKHPFNSGIGQVLPKKDPTRNDFLFYLLLPNLDTTAIILVKSLIG